MKNLIFVFCFLFLAACGNDNDQFREEYTGVENLFEESVQASGTSQTVHSGVYEGVPSQQTAGREETVRLFLKGHAVAITKKCVSDSGEESFANIDVPVIQNDYGFEVQVNAWGTRENSVGEVICDLVVAKGDIFTFRSMDALEGSVSEGTLNAYSTWISSAGNVFYMSKIGVDLED